MASQRSSSANPAATHAYPPPLFGAAAPVAPNRFDSFPPPGAPSTLAETPSAANLAFRTGKINPFPEGLGKPLPKIPDRHLRYQAVESLSWTGTEDFEWQAAAIPRSVHNFMAFGQTAVQPRIGAPYRVFRQPGFGNTAKIARIAIRIGRQRNLPAMAACTPPSEAGMESGSMTAPPGSRRPRPCLWHGRFGSVRKRASLELRIPRSSRGRADEMPTSIQTPPVPNPSHLHRPGQRGTHPNSAFGNNSCSPSESRPCRGGTWSRFVKHRPADARNGNCNCPSSSSESVGIPGNWHGSVDMGAFPPERLRRWLYRALTASATDPRHKSDRLPGMRRLPGYRREFSPAQRQVQIAPS